jgi:hypothetical protein
VGSDFTGGSLLFSPFFLLLFFFFANLLDKCYLIMIRFLCCSAFVGVGVFRSKSHKHPFILYLMLFLDSRI